MTETPTVTEETVAQTEVKPTVCCMWCPTLRHSSDASHTCLGLLWINHGFDSTEAALGIADHFYFGISSLSSVVFVFFLLTCCPFRLSWHFTEKEIQLHKEEEDFDH